MFRCCSWKLLSTNIINVFKSSLEIQGEFIFKIFDSSHNLLEEQKISNFITNTGLQYLKTLPFADCFRYVSLGTGLNQNSIVNGSDTTGLYSGISLFQYLGPNNNGYLKNACGYIETCSGVSLQKGWQIPLNGGFFSTNYNFKEFILTPGSPQTLPCTNEYTDFTTAYPNICTYTKAFTRITGNISVATNNYMQVFYNLNIATNTGINNFSMPINNAGAVSSTSTCPSASINWQGGLNGIYTIVNHGLKLVSSLTLANTFNNVIQPFNLSESICDSINPPLGSPLEPSTPQSNLFLYLSTDDTQFLVNSISGGAMNTGLYFPYNRQGLPFPSGTEYFQCSPTMSYLQNGNQVPFWLMNTRQGSNNNIFPNQSSYITNTNNTNVNWLVNPGPTSTSITYSSNGRTGTKNISIQIPNTYALTSDMLCEPIKSMVWIYSGLGNSYPFCDFIIKSQGNTFPLISTGLSYLSYMDRGNYNCLDGNNVLTMFFQETFSSPCNSQVLGC